MIKSTDRSFSVRIDDSDIAHTVDKDDKFGINEDKLAEGAYWFKPTDEHVMVWYQMESLKDFKKLYGRVDGTLKKGKEYVIAIYDNYAADMIDNEKHVVFSEVSTFGGKNYVLALFFLVASCITAAVMLFFIVGYFIWVQQRSNMSEEDMIKTL